MKKGLGLFGFIFGTVFGGIFTLLTAKRKGTEVRKDLYKAMKNKENITELLIKELKGLGDEAKKMASEVRSSELVEEYKEMATEKFDDLYKQAEKKMTEVRAQFDGQWAELRARFEEGKEEAKKQAIIEGKAIASKVSKTTSEMKDKVEAGIENVKAKFPKK